MTTLTRRLVAVTVSALAALWAAQPASAQVVQLRGTQSTTDGIVFTMTGDLVGDWYLVDDDGLRVRPSGTVQATGSELFVGCYDADGSGDCGGAEVQGWIAFDYQYSASASGNGRCHHPVVDAGDGFAGTSGQLTFKDRLGACGEVLTTYSGHLDL